MAAKIRAGAALALGAALVLGGCANQGRTAAVVNGRVITQSDIETASSEINKVNVQSQLSPQDTLQWLVAAPFILDQAAKAGKPVTKEAALAQLPEVKNPSAPTIELIRAAVALNSLTATGQQDFVKEMSKADVSVNPRYGTYDPKTASITTKPPAWISPAAGK